MVYINVCKPVRVTILGDLPWLCSSCWAMKNHGSWWVDCPSLWTIPYKSESASCKYRYAWLSWLFGYYTTIQNQPLKQAKCFSNALPTSIDSCRCWLALGSAFGWWVLVLLELGAWVESKVAASLLPFSLLPGLLADLLAPLRLLLKISAFCNPISILHRWFPFCCLQKTLVNEISCKHRFATCFVPPFFVSFQDRSVATQLGNNYRIIGQFTLLGSAIFNQLVFFDVS